MTRRWTVALRSIITTILLAAPSLRAADTIEPFDLGLSDFEIYTGFDGIGLDAPEQTAFAEGAVGCGVTPRLSFYLAPSFSVNGYLAGAVPGFVFGGYGTPLDGDHFDLELGLDLATDGEVMSYSPFFEMNLDLEPDLALAGLYLRGGLDVFGELNEAGQAATRLGTNATVGAYVTVAERHQLLVEFDGAWFVDPAPGNPETEIGGARLGYNVTVHDTIEIINEVSVDIPQADQDWSFGASVGLLMTLPAHE